MANKDYDLLEKLDGKGICAAVAKYDEDGKKLVGTKVTDAETRNGKLIITKSEGNPIEFSGEANVIEAITLNGQPQEPTDKTVNLEVKEVPVPDAPNKVLMSGEHGEYHWENSAEAPGNGELSIKVGSDNPVKFTANQSTNQEVNIPEAASATAQGAAHGGLMTTADKTKLDEIDLGITPGTDADSDKVNIQLKNNVSADVLTAHQDVSGKAEKSEMAISPVSGDETKKKITLKQGLEQEVVVAHQDVSGKAEKSEMVISTEGDRTTITLKNGTSATVINSHQDIPSASTSAPGIVQLSNDTNSSSESMAATSRAVKDAYDALDAKLNARAIFFGSVAEWDIYKTEHPTGDPSKVYYVQTGSGADKYTTYVWKVVSGGTSYYEETDESSISLDGYWHGTPSGVSDQNKTDKFVSGITLNHDGTVSVTTKGVQDAVASVSGVGGNHGLITAGDQEKLNGIAAGAQVNVKPDWKAASGTEAEILNKPTPDSSMSTREDNGITYWGVKNPLPGAIGNTGDVLTVKNGAPAWESRAKLPDAPNDNGKYVLTCTITNGTAVYAWESLNTTTV